jgi:hypothetical protein
MRKALRAGFWTLTSLLFLYTAQAALLFVWALKMRLPPAPVGDTRTASEVLATLGTGASLHFSPAFLVGRGWEGILPLGGRSRSTVVHCNEFGVWLTYPSDEHGFNNVRGAHKRAETVVIGDSFAEGACVRQGEDVAARLGALNLGLGGIGPLVELAILREFAAPLKPKRVYWLHYASDMADLRAEYEDPRIAGYVEQNLRARQKEADAAWERFEKDAREKGWAPKAGEGDGLSRWRRAARFLALYYLRAWVAGGYPLSAQDRLLLDRYYMAMAEAEHRIGRWGGRMTWVYLPERMAYVVPARADRFKRELLARMRAGGFHVIDAEPILSRDAFWLGRSTHYTAEGYRRLAEAIQAATPVDASAKSPSAPKQ